VVKSLLDILREVTLDPEQGAAFGADPSNYLAEQGYDDVADEDLREAFSLVADTLPAEQAHEVYTSHVVQGAGDALHPLPVHDEDPGAVYGHTTDDFDLDLDDATNQVIEPGAEAADESGLGFGDGADDDDADLDIAAMHYREDDDTGYDSDDEDHGDDDTDDTGFDHEVDDHAGLDLDVNPFDESHDTDLDDDTAGHHDMHYRDEDDDQAEHHDTGHHDLDLDLGFF
jgi:hypothetical protein